MKIFLQRSGLLENKQLKLKLRGFLFVFIFKFYISLPRLSYKNWRTQENLEVNNKDNTVFMSLGNLMFLKLVYLPLKLRFSSK